MKFRTMDIKYNNYQDCWEYTDVEIDGEREDTETFPHSLGFYHYPITKPTKMAFNETKDLLIKNYEENIKRIQTLMDKLRELEY